MRFESRIFFARLLRFLFPGLLFTLVFLHSVVFAQERNRTTANTPNPVFITNSTLQQLQSAKTSNVISYFREVGPGEYVAVPSKKWQRNFFVHRQVSESGWKLSPAVAQRNSGLRYAIHFLDPHILMNTQRTGWQVESMDRFAGVAVLRRIQGSLEDLIGDPNIVYIDLVAVPMEESPNSFQDLSVNRYNVVHNQWPDITGEGMRVSVKERNLDSTDIDLAPRILQSPLKDETISLHANQMATIIAGAGNTTMTSKGVAWKAEILSSSYLNPLPDALGDYGVSVQNHSYGVGIQNYYGPEARAYDVSATIADTILHVFSAGNSGLLPNTQGPYAGIPEYATITGNMKMAKNALVAGGHTVDYQIDARNSSGPAYDGRLKPEVSAFGPEGTSDAAAFVSGHVLLLQQAYLETFGSLPSTDLIKAIVIASSKDIGTVGIDFKTGYGAVDGAKSFEVLEANQWFQHDVAAGGVSKKIVTVPLGVARIQLCLNWNDPAAEAGALRGLVNDLDMRVIHTQSGTSWRPWVLSSYPHYDSLKKPARRSFDRLNNSELITIDNPAAGSYEVEITGFAVGNNKQRFAVAYSLDYTDSFKWTFPTSSDRINSSFPVIFRWDTMLQGFATLEVSINGGDYQVVSNQVDLERGFVEWSPGVVAGKLKARMNLGDRIVEGHEVPFNDEMALQVGFRCEEEVMLTWNKMDGVAAYELYHLENGFMTAFTTQTDTAIILPIGVNNFYAISPVIEGVTGYRSAAYNINLQGVGCYYSSFLASASNGEALLTLNLSTMHNVERIVWEKKVDVEFIDLGFTAISSGLVYTFKDSDLTPGISEYRARIVLTNGDVIMTEIATVYFVDDQSFFVYPNPIRIGEDISILTNGDPIEFQLLDFQGRLVKSEQILNFLVRLPIINIEPGIYLYRIVKNSRQVQTGRVLIY